MIENDILLILYICTCVCYDIDYRMSAFLEEEVHSKLNIIRKSMVSPISTLAGEERMMTYGNGQFYIQLYLLL